MTVIAGGIELPPFPTGAPAGGGGAVQLIAKNVLAAPGPSLGFSAIPATFNHLQLVVLARTTAAAESDHLAVTFNGDAGAHYDLAEFLMFNNAAVPVFSNAGGNNLALNVTGGSAGAGVAQTINALIPNYAATTFQKSVQILNGFDDLQTGAFNSAEIMACQWRSTAAINAIGLAPVTGPNFAAGSSAYLYGIT